MTQIHGIERDSKSQRVSQRRRALCTETWFLLHIASSFTGVAEVPSLLNRDRLINCVFEDTPLDQAHSLYPQSLQNSGRELFAALGHSPMEGRPEPQWLAAESAGFPINAHGRHCKCMSLVVGHCYPCKPASYRKIPL